MKSKKAKVLHELGGRPIIAHVVQKALALQPRKVFVVVGHQADAVEAAVRVVIDDDKLAGFVLQREQRGTGDAVMSAREVLQKADSNLLILSGDVPLVKEETLRKLVEHHQAKIVADLLAQVIQCLLPPHLIELYMTQQALRRSQGALCI